MKFSPLALAALTFAALTAQAATGPSTTVAPYLVPSAAGVEITSILTVSDQAADNGYKMVGLPDGMGVYDNKDGTFTVLMNHELGNTVGAVRAHGSNGAFVSQWTIRKSDLRVLAGQDMIQSANDVYLWNNTTKTWSAGTTTNNGRHCSADMAPNNTYFDPATKTGFKGRILLNGEETGAEGRAFAWVVGAKGQPNQLYQLPALGRAAWENAVTNRKQQAKTVVALMDDTTTNGGVYVYVGTKQKAGNPVEMAGLSGGKLYAIKVTGNQSEDTTDLPFGAAADGTFTLVDVTSSATADSGAQLNSATVASGGTNFRRPEDAAWNPDNANQLFVATTDSTSGRSRIWQLDFTDIANPEAGGTIRVAGDGGLGGTRFQMADNLTVDGVTNHVMFVEDVGNNARLGKLWDLNPTTGSLLELAAHDPARFVSGGAGYLTQDEEATGIVDLSPILNGEAGYDTKTYRYYLVNSQAHYANSDSTLVEGGQLQLVKVPKKLLKDNK